MRPIVIFLRHSYGFNRLFRMSGSDSESGDDATQSEEGETNPYPLEGKYIDEDDRERFASFISQRHDSNLFAISQVDGDGRN